ncbi:MAG: DnaA family protein [Planctomycetota bacterium]
MLGLLGQKSSGKTHLLNAGAYFARQQQIEYQIYDGRQLMGCDAAELEGFDRCELLAIDNLDALAGNIEWEKCFYQIINQCRAGQLRFLYSLSIAPQNLNCALEDFRSRLQWGLLLTLPETDDERLRLVLSQRATMLGIDYSKEVMNYLLSHYPRDLSVQMSILQQLDTVSLIRQRKVTVPLVKQALQVMP